MSNHEKRGMEQILPQELPEGTNPADLSILDIWPPELWENIFLFFQTATFV